MRKLFALFFLASVSTMAATTVSLVWNASTTAGVFYNVYRQTSPGACTAAIAGGCTKLNASPVPLATAAQPFTDAAPPASAKFYYVVRAVNANGVESVDSNEVSVDLTTPAAPGGVTCTLTMTGTSVSGSCK